MLTIVREKCDDLTKPIGIENRVPCFSWTLNSDRTAVYQQSYRLTVVNARSGQLVWDSGLCQSEKNYHILYEGDKLESRTRYEWSLEVYDNHGESAVSRGNYFETGMDLSDWQAVWVAPVQNLNITQIEDVEKPKLFAMFGQVDAVEGDGKLPDDLCPPAYIHRTFELENKEVASARLYMSARGIYQAHIDDQPVSDEIFAPGFSSYPFRIEYQTYDITDLLKSKEEKNTTVNIILGDGWYKGTYGILGFRGNYGKETSVLYQIEVSFTDGSSQVIASDGSEQCTFSSILYSDFLLGECYDARIDNGGNHGKCLGSENDKCWSNCYVAGKDLDHLCGKIAEGVKILERRKPNQVITTPKGETVLDFGQNMVGYLEFATDRLEDCKIILEYAEVLDAEGNFIKNISGFNRDQKDIYIAGKAKKGLYHPTFTSHGFRYVRLQAEGCEIDTSIFTACVIGSDLEQTGHFSCSDEQVNRLQNNIFWSQRGNMISIPTDCPQRERAGWTGDTAIFCNTAAFNMDMQAFYRRWLTDVRLEQYEDGQVPVIVPWAQGYRYLQLDMFGTDCSAGWSDVILELPWMLYTRYGNKTALSENYPAMLNWMKYVEKEAEQGLPDDFPKDASAEDRERQKYLWNTKFHYGDWLIPSCKNEAGETDMFGSAALTKELVATVLYARSTWILSQIAELLGHESEAHYYSELNAKIRRAYEEEYIGEDGSLKNPLQGLYVLTLAMDMVSSENRSKVVNKLIRLIQENEYKLDTGFMSIRYLLDVICKEGYPEVAAKMLYQNHCPGWMYEIQNGATTIWESWDAITENGVRRKVSYNHFSFGCVGDFMYRKLLGLNALKPGYQEFLAAPEYAFGLTSAEGDLTTANGKISLTWKMDNDCRYMYKLNVPVNSKAILLLPQGSKEVRVDGNPAELPEIPITVSTVDGENRIAAAGSWIGLESGDHVIFCSV